MYSMTASMRAALLRAFVLRNRSDRKPALWRHLLSINQVTNTLSILMCCIMPISSDHSFHDISRFQSHCSKIAKRSIMSLQLSFMPPRMGDGRQHRRNETQRRPVKWLLYKVVAQEQAQRRGRQHIVNDGCTFWRNNMHLVIAPLDFIGATKFDFVT
jgi:hypothetical protein